jgi:hypothetical protein
LGAFLLCSFWLVDTWLGKAGSRRRRRSSSRSAIGRPRLGLLAEQIDPASGAFLGNFPEAFGHIGVISSGVNLAIEVSERDPSCPPGWAAQAAGLPRRGGAVVAPGQLPLSSIAPEARMGSRRW